VFGGSARPAQAQALPSAPDVVQLLRDVASGGGTLVERQAADGVYEGLARVMGGHGTAAENYVNTPATERWAERIAARTATGEAVQGGLSIVEGPAGSTIARQVPGFLSRAGLWEAGSAAVAVCPACAAAVGVVALGVTIWGVHKWLKGHNKTAAPGGIGQYNWYLEGAGWQTMAAGDYATSPGTGTTHWPGGAALQAQIGGSTWVNPPWGVYDSPSEHAMRDKLSAMGTLVPGSEGGAMVRYGIGSLTLDPPDPSYIPAPGTDTVQDDVPSPSPTTTEDPATQADDAADALGDPDNVELHDAVNGILQDAWPREDPNGDGNPDDAPAEDPAPDPAPNSAPDPLGHPGPDSIPAVDFGPLSVDSGCTKFPFGVPCWVLGALGGWSGAGSCPSFEFPMPNMAGGDVPVDFCTLQPMVDVVRPVVAIGSLIGLAWLFMGAAMGFGAASTEE
jgi:hypothetical protein